MAVTYLFLAEFTKNGAKATPSVAPTIDIADALAPTGALLVSAGSPTQFTNMAGLYVYAYAAAPTTKPVAIFRTEDATVDLVDLPSYPIPFDANGSVEAALALQTGAYTVNITVENASTLATLADILVTLKDAGDTTIVRQARTSLTGVAQFSVDAATYKVHLDAPTGYASLAIQTLAVSANTNHTYALTPLAVGAPSSPDLCLVYGYWYLNGSPVAGRVVSAALLNLPQITTTVILEGTLVTATSDADGYWELELVRSKPYLFKNVYAGVDELEVTLPDADTLDLRTVVA